MLKYRCKIKKNHKFLHLLNSELRLVDFVDELACFWIVFAWIGITDGSVVGCDVRFIVANGDTYESNSLLIGNSSSVPGGGGLLASKWSDFSTDFSGIL